MSGNREKKKRRLRGEALTVLPLYVFTLLFVLGPIVYMIVLSFLTRAETWGVLPEFTLQNYKNIAEPVYLETFWESIKLALTSTVLVILIGYPFGYFMAKLTAKWKKRTMMLLMIPFWTSSLIRLYGWIIIFRAGGILDKLLMALHVTEKSVKILYTYPAVVVGMVYALLPFMIFAVYSSAEKLDFSLVEACLLYTSKSNCVAIFINQLREKVGIVYGNPEVTPGGRALKFYSSVRIDVRKAEVIKSGTDVIGSRTKAKVVKNKICLLYTSRCV